MSELQPSMTPQPDHGSSDPSFVVNASQAGQVASGQDCLRRRDDSEPTEQATLREHDSSRTPSQANLLDGPDGSAWRNEVSARLHSYRARRRTITPRYPSLRLKFEAPAAEWDSSVRTRDVSVASRTPQPTMATQQAPTVNQTEAASEPEIADTGRAAANPVSEPLLEIPTTEVTKAKIIEFPRTTYMPPSYLHDLAEPILDRPRIVEAPEIVPPPPALGGIAMEETQETEPDRRLGVDMPLQPAGLDLRLLAVAIDVAIIVLGGAMFEGAFYRISGIRPPLPQMAAFSGGLVILLWAAYQYLFVVYSGTTPGLQAVRLRLKRFDGSPASLRVRRWRVLASLLSGISLGLGYAWTFLDEDALCWHERVTKTYLAPEAHCSE